MTAAEVPLCHCCYDSDNKKAEPREMVILKEKTDGKSKRGPLDIWACPECDGRLFLFAELAEDVPGNPEDPAT
jgi:hypothetical protein